MPILRIGTGINEIVATTVRSNEDANLYFVAADGWDDFPEESRVSFKKPNGDGTWESSYATLEAKVVEVTLSYKDLTGNARNLRKKLAYWKALKTFFPVSIEREEDGATVVELLSCRFDSSPVLWKPTNNKHAAVNFVLKAPDPWKTLKINGEDAGKTL